METIFNKIIDEEPIRNNNKCEIVSIEGIDGSGKTTTVENCVKTLQNMGYRAVHFNTSSNYNLYWNTVEQLQIKGLIDPSTNQMLHNIAFLTYLRTEFINLLNSNDFVLSEWYIYGKLLLSELYEDSNKSKMLIESFIEEKKLLMPDHSFFLSLPVEEAYTRIINRRGRIESKESLIMLNKATNLWQKYIEKYDIETIDAMQQPEEISHTIVKKLVLNKK